MFSHLSACQKLGLQIWDASAQASFSICPWFGFGTADTVGMAKLNGWVGHHGRNGCQILCPMWGHHKPEAGNYYPAMLKPHGALPPGSSHPDINSITSTMRDFTMSLAPHPPTIMSAIVKKLEYANHPLYLCFQSLSQFQNVFL